MLPWGFSSEGVRRGRTAIGALYNFRLTFEKDRLRAST